MAQENQVAQAIQFGIRTQHGQGAIEITLAEGVMYVAQHLLQPRCHQCEVANVLQLNAAAYCRGPVAAVQQQIADALQIDNELQAGQQITRLFLVTWVMIEVTPWSMTRSRVSSSFSRSRTPSKSEGTPVAIPSATMPAAIRATRQACSVCSCSWAQIASGVGEHGLSCTHSILRSSRHTPARVSRPGYS